MTRAFAKTATITAITALTIAIIISFAAPKSRIVAFSLAQSILVSGLAGAWLVEYFQKEEEKIKRDLMLKRLERLERSFDKEAQK